MLWLVQTTVAGLQGLAVDGSSLVSTSPDVAAPRCEKTITLTESAIAEVLLRQGGIGCSRRGLGRLSVLNDRPEERVSGWLHRVRPGALTLGQVWGCSAEASGRCIALDSQAQGELQEACRFPLVVPFQRFVLCRGGSVHRCTVIWPVRSAIWVEGEQEQIV